MAKIAILGTGAWGTALGNVLLKNGHDVLMYGIDKKETSDLKKSVNTKYFGNTKMFCAPKSTLKEKDVILFKPSYILLAVPSAFIEPTVKKFASKLSNKPIYINVAKGFNPKTNDVWSVAIKKIIKPYSKGFVSLLGPSFAIEVFNNQATMINAVSTKKKLAKNVANLFNNSTFKCIVTTDEKGAEIMGSLKNVMAIALGLAYEMHTSINTRAAMLAEATKEISLIVKSLGGKPETISNFCGIGDIYLTCTDSKSRNFSFGKSIAQVGLKQTLSQNKKTVEGYSATKIAYKIILKEKINAPVLSEIYKVLYKDKNPKFFVNTVIKKIIK